MRTVAFDGLNSVKVPDSDRNRSWLGKTMTNLGLAGYPAMRTAGQPGWPRVAPRNPRFPGRRDTPGSSHRVFRLP